MLAWPGIGWGAYGEQINTGDAEIIYHFEGDCADSGIGADDTCTPTSTAYTQSGYFGQGIQFDNGTNDSVTVPYTNIVGFNSGTIEFWIKTVDAGASLLRIYSISDADQVTDTTFLFAESTAPYIRFSNTQNNIIELRFEVAENIFDQAWHYIAIVAGSGYNWICVDGSFPTVSFPYGSASTSSFSDINNPSHSYIGQLYYNSINYYDMDGILDEFVIYPGKTFTKAEIRARYAMQKGKYGVID